MSGREFSKRSSNRRLKMILSHFSSMELASRIEFIRQHRAAFFLEKRLEEEERLP